MPRHSPQAAPADRVLLSVPYAEKDLAKPHGALWDAALKTWWISGRRLAKRPALWRWVPDAGLLRQMKQAANFSRPEPLQTQSAIALMFPYEHEHPLPACGCTSPPWEHCSHTLQAGLLQ